MVFIILSKCLAGIIHFSMYFLPHDLGCSLVQVLLWESHAMKSFFFFFFPCLHKGLLERKSEGYGQLSHLVGTFCISLVSLFFEQWILLAKTDAQLENCELSYTWSKMNTGAQETAPQITLRDCSKRRWGKVGVWDSVQSSANLTKSISASHEELMSPLSDLGLF